MNAKNSKSEGSIQKRGGGRGGKKKCSFCRSMKQRCVKDSNDGPCNRCKTKGRRCGALTFPKDDPNHRIPKRVSVYCQTEPQSAEGLEASNSGMQCQTQLDQSAMPTVGHFGDIPQLEVMGDFLNTALLEGDGAWLEWTQNDPQFEADSMFFWDSELEKIVMPVLESTHV